MNKNTLLKVFAIAIDKFFSWINVQQRVNLLSELILALTKNLPPEDRLKVLLDLAGMKPMEIFVRWGEIYGVFVPN